MKNKILNMIRTLCLTGLLTGIFAASAFAEGEENPEALFMKAMQMETRDADYKGAIKIYEEIIKKNEKSIVIAAKTLFSLYRMGVCYEKIKDEDRARECSLKLRNLYAEMEKPREMEDFLRKYSAVTRLEFPDTWELKQGLKGTALFGVSPLENAQDTFRENVKLIVEKIRPRITDAEYLKMNLSNLNKIKMFVSLNKEFVRVKVGNNQGYHLRYSGKMGQIDVDNDLYIVIQDGIAYGITCTCAKGKRDTFKPIIDSIIKTFAIK